MIRSALQRLSSTPLATGAKQAAGSATSLLASRPAASPSVSWRQISEQTSLTLPPAWMKADIGRLAHGALKKLGGPPLDDWYKTADTHAKATRQLNQRLAQITPEAIRKAGLHPQELLSLVLMCQQGLGAVGKIDPCGQSGHDEGTVSLAARLLSFLPVPTHLQRHMAAFCQELVHEAAGPLALFDASRDWIERPPEEREALMRACFQHAKALVPPAGTPTSSLQDIQLDLVHEIAGRKVDMFDGRMSTKTTYDGQMEVSGVLSLSQSLITMDPARYAQSYPLAHATGDAGAAIVPILMGHELWHGFQHYLLDGLPKGPAAGSATQETLTMALSIGTQEQIRKDDLGVITDKKERLLIHLPHEKQAWAVTFLMARAMVRDPQVPQRVKAGALAYAANSFEVFRPLFGGGAPPRPAGPDGQFWKNKALQLDSEPLPPAGNQRAAVEAFMHEPLAIDPAPKGRTMSTG